jgi:hypothetical protein
MSRKSLSMAEVLKTTLGGTRLHHYCFSEEYWEVVGYQRIGREALGDPGLLQTVYMNLVLLRRRYELCLEEALC